jgi:DNA invertase Pin-like site-specific DNA recombinase
VEGKKVRVAIYCRVSTDQQELEQQIVSCQKFCDYKSFDGVLFKDIGSGKNMRRPEFLDMINRIRQGEFQGIVVFRYDRLGRNAREVVTLFEEFEGRGIQLFSLNENIDTSTPAGKMVRDVIIKLAQLERENISAATKQRLQALKNLGKHLGRPQGSKDKKKRPIIGYKTRWAVANRDNKGRVRKVELLPLSK